MALKSYIIHHYLTLFWKPIFFRGQKDSSYHGLCKALMLPALLCKKHLSKKGINFYEIVFPSQDSLSVNLVAILRSIFTYQALMVTYRLYRNVDSHWNRKKFLVNSLNKAYTTSVIPFYSSISTILRKRKKRKAYLYTVFYVQCWIAR